MTDSFFNEALTNFRFLLLGIVLWHVTSDCPAQTIAQVDHSRQDITYQLSTGILVFVMPDYSAKLSALRKELAAEGKSPRKRRVQKLIHRTTQERDQFQKELIVAVDSIYDFSKKGFIRSGDLEAFRKGSLHLLMKQSDPISVSNRIFYMKRATLESGADALIIYDHDLQRLSRPFPYYVRTQSFRSVLESLFSSKAAWRTMPELVQQLNDKLYNFAGRDH
ncbi:MAG: hypothetical protein OEQ53_20545 [Saprospiraceae bacterium]|nr:hypothetical protein [Saprospiraceae bacterium]